MKGGTREAGKCSLDFMPGLLGGCILVERADPHLLRKEHFGCRCCDGFWFGRWSQEEDFGLLSLLMPVSEIAQIREEGGELLTVEISDLKCLMLAISSIRPSKRLDLPKAPRVCIWLTASSLIEDQYCLLLYAGYLCGSDVVCDSNLDFGCRIEGEMDFLIMVTGSKSRLMGAKNSSVVL